MRATHGTVARREFGHDGHKFIVEMQVCIVHGSHRALVPQTPIRRDAMAALLAMPEFTAKVDACFEAMCLELGLTGTS